MPDVVRINQTPYSWTSTVHNLEDSPYEGITGVDWEEKRERKLVYAARQDGTPLGMTSGKVTPALLKLRMLMDTANAFMLDMTVLGLGSYGDAKFTYTLQYVEPDFADIPITVNFENCSIIGKRVTMEEGIEEAVTEFDIQCLASTQNGMQLASLVRAIL